MEGTPCVRRSRSGAATPPGTRTRPDQTTRLPLGLAPLAAPYQARGATQHLKVRLEQEISTAHAMPLGGRDTHHMTRCMWMSGK